MLSRFDSQRTAVADTVFGESRIWLTISVVFAVAFGVLSRHSLAVYASALAIGVVALVSILISLRFYNPWLSWVGWIVPLFLFGVVIEPVRRGIVPVFNVFFAYALAAVIVFAIFTVMRDRLRKWVTTGAF